MLQRLTMLRQDSWVTQLEELAKAFAHQPSLLSFGEDDQRVKHNGQEPGFLYQVSEIVGPEEVCDLSHTAQTHWQAQRAIRLQMVAALSIGDPPQLSAEAIAAMRHKIPEGTTGFIGDRDEE